MWVCLSPTLSLVCGPPGRFFDVMCDVSLGTEEDGKGLWGKAQSLRNERCEAQYESGWQRTLVTESESDDD